MRNIKNAINMLTIALLLSLILTLCCAAENEPVKVGYFSCGDYYHLREDGSTDSYDSAYLSAVSDCTGLSFVFVDCGTWQNAVKMLESHQIDLLGTMQKNAEREAQFALCENNYGITATELVALPDTPIGYADPSCKY